MARMISETAAALLRLYGIEAWRVARERASDDPALWSAVLVSLDRIYSQHSRG